MKKNGICLLLCFVLAVSLLAGCTGQVLDGDGMVNYAVEGNLLKLEGSHFYDGTLDGLKIEEIDGIRALVLADGKEEGTFTSHEYPATDFTQMVASWNAFIYRS